MREKSKPMIRGQVPTSRNPISGDMLICFDGKWQVCYQARGKIEDRVTTAWVYGPGSHFFCEAGKEDHRVNLPIPDETPFFDDQFNFAIDEIAKDGSRTYRLAGANDVSSAIAAYEEIKSKSTRIIQMRNGMRIIRRSDKD